MDKSIVEIKTDIEKHLFPIREKMRKIERCRIRPLWFCVITLAVMLVALFPLLTSHYLYEDDLVRSTTGLDGWDAWSRWLANELSHIIHTSDFLSYLLPIGQIIAVVTLSVAAMIVIRNLKGELSLSIWDVLGTLILGLNPYFLQCLSYSYDSPYMALSVLFAVLPLAMYRRDLAYQLTVFVTTIGMCSLYQASSGIFPLAVIFSSLCWWLRGEDARRAIRNIVSSAVPYLIALLFFKVFMSAPQSMGYASTALVDSPLDILRNLVEYWKLVKADFGQIWGAVTLCLVMLYILTALSMTTRRKPASAMAIAAALFSMLLITFGVYPALQPIATSPRAMYGVGMYLFLIACGTCSFSRSSLVQRENGGGVLSISNPMRVLFGILSRALLVVLAWHFIAFTVSYGNALAQQGAWERFRVIEVVADMTDLPEAQQAPKMVQVVGSAGYARQIERNSDSRMLRRLIGVRFREDSWYLNVLFNDLCDLGTRGWSIADESYQVDDYEEIPLLHESEYHRIRYKDGLFVIELT